MPEALRKSPVVLEELGQRVRRAVECDLALGGPPGRDSFTRAQVEQAPPLDDALAMTMRRAPALSISTLLASA